MCSILGACSDTIQLGQNLPAPSAGGAGASAGVAGTLSFAGGAGIATSGSKCHAVDAACQAGGDCCSGICDPKTGCVASLTTCAGTAEACTAGTDCCSLSCVAGNCSSSQCSSDSKACASNDVCCSGACGANQTCTPLNTSCKTAGNECATNSDCCSGLCDGTKHCALTSSFCIQPSDACARDGDCCTANCVIASGHAVGACAPPPTGPAYCTKVDGMLCAGCGDCCSRLCGPGPAGVSICQPASGCHVTGDLCLRDTDCCGGDPASGLPGAGNGQCHLDPGSKIGICANPMNGGTNACNPEGNVCHDLADPNYACASSSARSDCCGPLNPKAQMCHLDALGVPRCQGIGMCHAVGDVCANAADCCNNVPCTPNATGALHCNAAKCVPSGGACTINGDCCPGILCHRAPGTTVGSCTTTTTTGTSGSGAGGGSSTGGSSGTGGAPTACAQYGQICAIDGDCCNSIPCTFGICTVPVVK